MASYEIGGRRHRVRVAASEDLGEGADAFLAIGLVPAMALGVALRVPGRVSSRLLEGTARIQQIFRLWFDQLRVVEVEAAGRPEQGPRGERVGAFFSGGVDSFYAVLRYREQIDDLIFVHGLDIPLSGREGLRRQASEMAREAAYSWARIWSRSRQTSAHSRIASSVGATTTGPLWLRSAC